MGQVKHGMSGSRIYQCWQMMFQRCKGVNNVVKKHYTDRGITVCGEWADFDTFYAWAMTNGYRDDLTLDRIDNDGNYEPANCRWADMAAQGNNKGNNVRVEIDGVEHTVSEWCKITGVSRATVQSRMDRGVTGADIFDIKWTSQEIKHETITKKARREAEPRPMPISKRDKALARLRGNRAAKLAEMRGRFGLGDTERSGRMAE